jgi:LAGLIDADG endonuclease
MRLHIAYIAGFLDADGCINAHLQLQAVRHRCPAFGIDVTFANQDLGVLEAIQETLSAGKIRAVRNNNRSGSYRLDFSRPETKRVLETLLPYLVIKREQAELALLAIATINPRRGGKLFVTPEERAYRMTVIQRMQELNQRNGKAFRTKWVNSVEPSTFAVTGVETMPSQAATGTEGDLKVLRKV